MSPSYHQTPSPYPKLEVGLYGLLVLLLAVASSLSSIPGASGTGANLPVGVNWGMQTSHRLPPKNVVKMLMANGIRKVKLFEADPDTLSALRDTAIEVMLGIPNDMLLSMGSKDAAKEWVSENVTSFIKKNVNIRYIAVGNEAFLKTYNGSFLNSTLPALQNVHSALLKAGLTNQVALTVPLNADIYDSQTGLPSNGDFKPETRYYVLQILRFLSANNYPFTVNIYPFLSVYNDPEFPPDYAFFDGNPDPVIDDNNNDTSYENMFDANYDTLVWALQKNGFESMEIIVGEIGWPTDGNKNATSKNAEKFNQGFIDHVTSGKGTPMRPGLPINAYLFSLIDEDTKSIAPGNFERHWGIFSYDGRPKYNLATNTVVSAANTGVSTANTGVLAPVEGVKYQDRKWCIFDPKVKINDHRVAKSVSDACGGGDCTRLGYQTSCGLLDVRGNISYAFNSFYQVHNQEDEACKFSGIGAVTRSDPRENGCIFEVMIEPYYGGAERAALKGLSLKTCGLILLLFLSTMSIL